METFECCECEKVFHSLDWFGVVDTCLTCSAELDGEDLEALMVEAPEVESSFVRWA